MKLRHFAYSDALTRLLAKRNKGIPEPFPPLPNHLLACAPTMSGKSNTLMSLLYEGGPYYKRFDRIYLVGPYVDHPYRDYLDIPDEQVIHSWTPEHLERIVKEQKAAIADGEPLLSLILFDDCQSVFRDQPGLQESLSWIRHVGVSIWATAQYLRGCFGPLARTQFHSYIVWSNIRAVDLDTLSELSPASRAEFKQALAAVRDTKDRYATMYITPSARFPFWHNFTAPIVGGRIVRDAEATGGEASGSGEAPAAAGGGSPQ